MVAVRQSKDELRDGFSTYLSSIANHPPIPVERERELARRFKETGDKTAAKELMLANLRFVVKVALEYRRYRCDLNDLVQEGNLGLAEALQRFDPERGTRLVTYAAWWIRDRIRQKIARSRSVSAKGTTRAERKLSSSGSESGGLPRDLPLDWVDPARLATFEAPDVELIRAEETERLRRAVAEELEVLDNRERHIARMRFLAEQPLPLSALGDQFGVSRERVRQLAERTRKKLQNRLRRRGFC